MKEVRLDADMILDSMTERKPFSEDYKKCNLAIMTPKGFLGTLGV